MLLRLGELSWEFWQLSLSETNKSRLLQSNRVIEEALRPRANVLQEDSDGWRRLGWKGPVAGTELVPIIYLLMREINQCVVPGYGLNLG